MAEVPVTMRDRLEDAGLAAGLGLLRGLPYAARVRLAGRAMVALSGPLGLRARVRENLAHVLPDLPATEVAALERAVPDTIGRVFVEEFSPDGLDRAARAPTSAATGSRRWRKPARRAAPSSLPRAISATTTPTAGHCCSAGSMLARSTGPSTTVPSTAAIAR